MMHSYFVSNVISKMLKFLKFHSFKHANSHSVFFNQACDWLWLHCLLARKTDQKNIGVGGKEHSTMLQLPLYTLRPNVLRWNS